MKRRTSKRRLALAGPRGYESVLSGMVELLAAARGASARTVNAIMTATYWEMGRRIVESEQAGSERAEYGERLLERLSQDLTARFGRGFGLVQLNIMRQFYPAYPRILQSAIEEFGQPASASKILQSPIEESRPETRPSEISQSVIGKSEQSGQCAQILRSPIVEPASTPTPPICQSVIGHADDTRLAAYGVYYAKKKPLTAAAITEAEGYRSKPPR